MGMFNIRLSDAAALLGARSPNGRVNHAAVARAFGVSRFLPRTWGGLVPELYTRRLVDRLPHARDYVIDPDTGLTLIEMRARLSARAPPAAS